jgi:hypothetical protein
MEEGGMEEGGREERGYCSVGAVNPFYDKTKNPYPTSCFDIYEYNS